MTEDETIAMSHSPARRDCEARCTQAADAPQAASQAIIGPLNFIVEAAVTVDINASLYWRMNRGLCVSGGIRRYWACSVIPDPCVPLPQKAGTVPRIFERAPTDFIQKHCLRIIQLGIRDVEEVVVKGVEVSNDPSSTDSVVYGWLPSSYCISFVDYNLPKFLKAVGTRVFYSKANNGDREL
ncbi:hypothetical protein Pelo_19731 [Pelomyxa schiedti]|nr:hypothetical protein Pelo_19731 [Pelomyxa schiedti]